MSRTQVQLWYNRFKGDRDDVYDDARPGRPLISTTDENNRRITVREVADDVGISFDSCQAIFKDVLGMKFAAARIVPKLPNFEQKKKCRLDIAQEILTTFNDDPDLQ